MRQNYFLVNCIKSSFLRSILYVFLITLLFAGSGFQDSKVKPVVVDDVKQSMLEYFHKLNSNPHWLDPDISLIVEVDLKLLNQRKKKYQSTIPLYAGTLIVNVPDDTKKITVRGHDRMMSVEQYVGIIHKEFQLSLFLGMHKFEYTADDVEAALGLVKTKKENKKYNVGALYAALKRNGVSDEDAKALFKSEIDKLKSMNDLERFRLCTEANLSYLDGCEEISDVIRESLLILSKLLLFSNSAVHINESVYQYKMKERTTTIFSNGTRKNDLGKQVYEWTGCIYDKNGNFESNIMLQMASELQKDRSAGLLIAELIDDVIVDQ